MPIAYITGRAGFYGREFAVNEHVLVPRAETEHLVEDAIAFLNAQNTRRGPSPTLRVFEAGIGSGAVACTIAAEVAQAAVEGTDISARAVRTARDNARRLSVDARCDFHLGNVVKPHEQSAYDLIVANLPYIPTSEIPQRPDPVGFEPVAALDGGPDGLAQYRSLLTDVSTMLRPGALLLMEAAPPTMQTLSAMTRSALPGADVEVRRDYAGLERYLYVRATGSR